MKFLNSPSSLLSRISHFLYLTLEFKWLYIKPDKHEYLCTIPMSLLIFLAPHIYHTKTIVYIQT